MSKKVFAWLGMTLLAFAVAAYAGALVVVPEFRPPLVPAIAWFCWVPNLLVAEWFVRSQNSSAILTDDSLKTNPLRGAA